MLVISRKAGEGIMIGDNIRLTVSELSKDRVKIGIEAPPDVKIIRKELYYTKEFNVQAAMTKLPADLVNIVISGSTKSEKSTRKEK